MALARALLLENTVEPSPKGQSLARATASASVQNFTTAKTGPNTSSLQSGIPMCQVGMLDHTAVKDCCIADHKGQTSSVMSDCGLRKDQ